MARPSTVLLLSMILLASLCSCLEARKLALQNNHNKVSPSSRRDNLFLNALPKGTVQPSSPSKKGHDTEVEEKLISRHLITIDRVLLKSVPSPGAGH
ncbi:precursor of CEP14 [Vigna unguiculata]|uniref:Precursor of CEP14 n=1 Tax=Vigna unguiculata TaxID=3917 RepID=A0A4D6L7K2_VIGUN|nr:precursor of CEP14 [Vigna unguiculata]QCD84499.1 hypothetical protein DEO72_LG2g4854 [Vigna unguiculata]